MEEKKEYSSALKVNAGIKQPPSINPAVLGRSAGKEGRNILRMNMLRLSWPGTEQF